jgi:hypothetical protein
MNLSTWRLIKNALANLLIPFAMVTVACGQPATSSNGQFGAGATISAPPKHKIGIFGFGSLIADPGEELATATVSKLEAETPFAIEYAHSSTHTRGGAPTLVPVTSGGAKAKATIFVLSDSISEQEAANILWRRETRQVGSGKSYKPSTHPGSNSVLVAAVKNYQGIDTILYTDFADSGKLTNPTAQQLAELAVTSARNPEVPEGMDGISYLMAAKRAGIITPLTADYERGILKLTGASSLEEALRKVRGAP